MTPLDAVEARLSPLEPFQRLTLGEGRWLDVWRDVTGGIHFELAFWGNNPGRAHRKPLTRNQASRAIETAMREEG